MDRYSELEIKYDASQVPVSKFQKFMEASASATTKVHQVVGLDTFYANPNTGLVLRFRRASSEGNDHPVLTFKKRKGGGDSVDRHEVDLFLEKNASTDADAAAFVAALGCSEDFSILKESYIYHVDCGDYTAVVALYDVIVPGTNFIRRFLEVEIDKEGPCLLEVAQAALGAWATIIEGSLQLAKPLGQSLYELIAPYYGDAKLYVPGTF